MAWIRLTPKLTGLNGEYFIPVENIKFAHATSGGSSVFLKDEATPLVVSEDFNQLWEIISDMYHDRECEDEDEKEGE